MGNQSKLLTVPTTCIEYVHPWTDSCINANAGVVYVATLDSFKIYTAVYVVTLSQQIKPKPELISFSIFQLSLVMRGRIPKKKELIKTILGIIQSSAFLTTSAFSYTAYICLLRAILGNFNFWTVSYIPAVMSSLTAITIERESRRGLLTMYVANVATETLWNMAVSRKMVKNIPHGQVLIFGVASSVLLYYFRSGWHLDGKDSVFDIVRFVVGRDEEGGVEEILQELPEKKPKRKNSYKVIQQLMKTFTNLTDRLKALSRHEKCPHKNSCAYYTISGGTKLFGIGLGIQVALKLLMNIRKIALSPKKISDVFWTADTLKIGGFLGGFAFIYRVSSIVFASFQKFDIKKIFLSFSV